MNNFRYILGEWTVAVCAVVNENFHGLREALLGRRNTLSVVFPSVPANNYADVVITVPGAYPSMAVLVCPLGVPPTGLMFTAWATDGAANSVTIRAWNCSSSVSFVSATINFSIVLFYP